MCQPRFDPCTPIRDYREASDLIVISIFCLSNRRDEKYMCLIVLYTCSVFSFPLHLVHAMSQKRNEKRKLVKS